MARHNLITVAALLLVHTVNLAAAGSQALSSPIKLLDRNEAAFQGIVFRLLQQRNMFSSIDLRKFANSQVQMYAEAVRWSSAGSVVLGNAISSLETTGCVMA